MKSLYFIILSIFLTIPTYGQYNYISQNGPGEYYTGYQYEFSGADNDNCLQTLGLISWHEYFKLRSTVDQKNGYLILTGEHFKTDIYSKPFASISNYFSYDNCISYLNNRFYLNFTEDLSLVYKIRSNKKIQNFQLSPTVEFFSFDTWYPKILPFYPKVALEENIWKTFTIQIKRDSQEWYALGQDVYNYDLERVIGFQIDLHDSSLVSDTTFKLEIDFIRFGDLASKSIVNGLISYSENQEIHTFPNPFQNFISFQGSSDIDYIEIINIENKVIKVYSKDLSSKKLDLSELNQGIYFIKYYTKNQIISVDKIIKN